MAEYRLPYTAEELTKRLGKIDKTVITVNGISPDVNGNVEVAAGGFCIIEVDALPTENINKAAIYSVTTGQMVMNKEVLSDDGKVYCVKNLPNTASSMENNIVCLYYNISDKQIYIYIDDTMTSIVDASVGWHLFSDLVGEEVLIIYNIDDDPCDDIQRMLITNEYYIYCEDWWYNIPFGYQKQQFNIQWNGDKTDKLVIDVSSLVGVEGMEMVKISDLVLTAEQLLNSSLQSNNGETYIIDDNMIATEGIPGSVIVDGGSLVSVYSAENFSAAFGLPTGYLTNGLYSFYNTNNDEYVKGLSSPVTSVQINKKFLPNMSNDNYVTSSQVEIMISNAIGSAIGGSY